MTDNSGAQTFAYDDNDSLTSFITTYTGLPAETIGYTYYNNSSRHTMATPAGGFSYSYDGAGRMTSLTNPFSETTSWGYANNNWLTSQQMANGDTTSIGYNGRAEVMSQATAQGTTTLADFAVANSGGYDAVGNRLLVAVTMSGMANGQTAYQYDGRNEVTSEASTRSGDAGGTYAYDAAENPTTFRGSSVGAATADNQLPGNTFDGDGNPTTYGGNTLTFDPQNRMTSYNGSTLTCGYREDGLRAWKQNGNGRTYFLYDYMSRAVCELNSSGAVTATNTYGINELISRRPSAVSTFYDFDLSSNVAQRLSSSGTLVSTDVDDAFGKRTTNDMSNDPFAFSGQWGGYTDVETGLVLLDHRFYDPAIGRWLTRDPIKDAGGANLYGYTRNNPINRIDPSGFEPVPIGNSGFCFDLEKVIDCIKDELPDITTECLEGVAEGLSQAIEDCMPSIADIPAFLLCIAGAEFVECLKEAGPAIIAAAAVCFKSGFSHCPPPIPLCKKYKK